MKILLLAFAINHGITAALQLTHHCTCVPRGVPAVIRHRQQPRTSLSRRWYRELDQDDDDDALRKVQTRAPPGFDVKENLAKLNQGDEGPSSGLNILLIRALLINQGLILTIATVISLVMLFTTDGFDALSRVNEIFQWSGTGDINLWLTPNRLLIGAVAAVPIVAFGNLVEESDQRIFANINFSTITMVLTLFGRRTKPPDAFLPPNALRRGANYRTTSTMEALVMSFVLSTITGFCEETVFRMEVPALIHHYFDVGDSFPFLPLFGQAVLFALGHSQPRTSVQENSVVVALQLVNGVWFGLVYILAGGDLVPCMVAHAVYDFVVFFKTWWDANGQIEYAESMWLAPLPNNIQRDVDIMLLRGMDPKIFNRVKRLFYTFDFDKNKSLSKSEVRKGFSYLALERAGTPPPQNQIDVLFDNFTSAADKSRLTFSDFLRLYTASAVRRAN